MKEFLVGYTGFVGSNIARAHHFDGLFNSKNISEAFGQNPDLLVYAGIPARKYFANENPEQDLKIIEEAEENIRKINPKFLILISTIDVVKEPRGVDEETEMSVDDLQPYGRNRLILENWVKENFDHHLIVRLPALYGENLKKNFIYDILNPIPKLIKSDKYDDLVRKNKKLSDYYTDNNDGYYVLNELNDAETVELKKVLDSVGFSALSFTDSRAKYQFYNLKNLWEHLTVAKGNNIKLLHLATEPVGAGELYDYIFSKEFKNCLAGEIANYDYRTKYSSVFSGKNGYIFSKDVVLRDIKQFIEENKK